MTPTGVAAAVVLVEPAAFEHDADVAEDLLELSTTGRADGERIVGKRLHDLEVIFAVSASVFVCGHGVVPRKVVSVDRRGASSPLALGVAECQHTGSFTMHRSLSELVLSTPGGVGVRTNREEPR